MSNVVISPNIKKVSERIDPYGNVINPRTKEIIVENKPEEVFSTPEPAKEVKVIEIKSSPLDIQKQIDEAKENLNKLEELKKLKIAEMKAQLELLEQ